MQQRVVSSSLPSESPEDRLKAFWRDYTACREDDKWDDLPWSEYEDAMREVMREYCTARLWEGKRFQSRGASEYGEDRQESVTSVEIKKNRFRWKLKAEDGVWRIDRREEEGLQVDKYRETRI